MPVETRITDPRNGDTAYVDVSDGEPNALVVATRELKERFPVDEPFTNTTYGIDMNQDATVGGTPEKIHNGTDNMLWTASAIAGTWDFASTTEAHTGTKSIDATATVNNDTAEFDKGSTVDLSGYVELSGWIYITSWSTLGTKRVDVYGWDGATVVGVTVDIGDYVNTALLDTWQQFRIPLTDMGLSAAVIQYIRVTSIDVGPGLPIDYYLDDLQFEETGGAIVYEVAPDPGTWLRVAALSVVFVNDVASTLADATMPNIAYNSYLGESAAVGVIYQRVTLDELVTAVFKGIGDWLVLPNTFIASNMSDGTNTQITLQFNFNTPVRLKAEESEKLRIIINDDLSGLTKMQVWATGTVEIRDE